MKMMSACIAAGVVLLSLGAAQAQTVMTGAKSMSLYTFDKDKGGTPTCYADCATNWPPYLGKTGEKMSEGWTLVERKDGGMQWAYDGKPTYYFARDAKPGDTSGDGMGGVWHVLKE